MNSPDEENAEEAKPFLNFEEPRRKYRQPAPRLPIVIPWTLTAISWIITVYLFVSTKQCSISKELTTTPSAEQTCPKHFETDFPAMQSIVSYETRRFTGEIIYNPKDNLFHRNLTANETIYAAPPSPQVDEAWNNLLRGEFAVMLPEEAEVFEPELRPVPTDNHFHFEPMVLHELHCLNSIRMTLDVDYYGEEMLEKHLHADLWQQKNWARIHMDHCIDLLRQSIMCHGDLSPVPLYSWPNVQIAVGQGQEHTCRKWEPIKQWMDERAKVAKALNE